MTSDWSLSVLFADFHAKIERELATARNLGHPTEKGDASEQVWNDVFRRSPIARPLLADVYGMAHLQTPRTGDT